MNWPGYTTWPAYHQAIHDRAVHKSDLIVLDTLRWELMFGPFKAVKRAWVARVTRMREENVRRSLRRLRTLGYLELDPDSAASRIPTARRYRLVYYNPQRSPVTPFQAA